jgi:acyl-coenzyme A thioesterase PaaI-like protein
VPEHIGFKGVVHGGITATVLDEIMVWACVVATKPLCVLRGAERALSEALARAGSAAVTVTSELVADRKGRIFEAQATMRDHRGGRTAW